MASTKLIPEEEATGKVKEVYGEIKAQSPAQSPSFVTQGVTTGHPAFCYDVTVIEVIGREKRWTRVRRDTQN